MSSISVAGALQRDKARPTDENSEKRRRYYAPRWSLLKLPACHRPRPLYISLYRSLGKPGNKFVPEEKGPGMPKEVHPDTSKQQRAAKNEDDLQRQLGQGVSGPPDPAKMTSQRDAA